MTGSSSVPNQKMTAMKPSTDAQISATSCQPPASSTNGRDELGHGGADIADAEDAERRALLAGGIEARDIGDADRKGTAGQPDAERGDQHLRVGRGEREQEGCHRRRQHGRRVDQTAAEAVGPDAEHDAHERAGEDRHADQQAELGFGQPEFGFDLHADDRKDRPHREADGKGERGHGQRPRGRSVVGEGWSAVVVILRSMAAWEAPRCG